MTTQTVRAPELGRTTQWLNTDKPIKLSELNGQVVLLAFWSYSRLDSLYMLADLRLIQERYRDRPVVVLGVHSGKFEQEKVPANISDAIRRNRVEFPVAIDSDYRIWKAYGVRAWPTLVLIDPEGQIAELYSGLTDREELSDRVGTLLNEYRGRRTLGSPLNMQSGQRQVAGKELEFPGNVLADGGQVFIADTHNHRVLLADGRTQVQQVIGSGEDGLRDGPFGQARFNQPRGMALSADRQLLYIADTTNHAIRVANLQNQRVTTLCGSGLWGTTLNPSGSAKAVSLNSPWGLVRVDDDLYVSMAGSHQIWRIELRTEQVSVLAGTGQEGHLDGPNRTAVFAQPCGLATDGQLLYVADAQSSCIRTVELGSHGQTRTLAGNGGLYHFGHRDGPARQALFQYPLGVAVDGDTLLVADTFNDRIRRVRLSDGWVSSVSAAGRAGNAGGPSLSLVEPGGLSIASGNLYVADTNRHRITVTDLATWSSGPLTTRMPPEPIPDAVAGPVARPSDSEVQ